MNKLFVFQKDKEIHESYIKELRYGYDIASKKSNKTKQININDLSVDYLLKNEIDVVVSNGLSKEWYLILKGLQVAVITIDDISKYHDLSDIVIDPRSEESNKYFTGIEYSIYKNKDFEIEFDEIINLIKKLQWDSGFWGFPVSYLSCRHLTKSIMHRINIFIKRENIKLIEYLCNCHDNRSVKITEQSGFHFTDIRLSFEKKLKGKTNVDLDESFTFSLANEKDINILKEIAYNLYKDGRYYFDGNFNINKVNEFYEGWVEKAVLGQYDDECYCLYKKDKPIGFCTLKFHISNSANIGLVGLSNEYRGKGIGKILLYLVFNKLIDKGISKVSIVTQGRNYAAQRLYQKVGFLTKATELWFHKWL